MIGGIGGGMAGASSGGSGGTGTGTVSKVAKTVPPVPGAYYALFPMLLNPVLWDRVGCIPALVPLLKEFVQALNEKLEPDQIVGLLSCVLVF